MTETIAHVHGRQVFDSRGRPTVEVEVTTSGGFMGRAIAPSGASTGRHEALELRDNDAARFGGLGVSRAVSHVCGEIHAELVGSDVVDQERIDRKLVQIDGTPNRSRLGANALLGVSLAVARAAAASQNLPLWRYLDRGGNALLPMPMVNIISGGLHAGGAADFQDYLIIPVGAASYHEALEMCLQVHRTTAEVLQQLGHPTLKADEGGYGPVLPDNRAALDLLMQVVDRAGYAPGQQIAFALDVAASHFYSFADKRYQLKLENCSLDAGEMVDRLADLVGRYPIISIEDGLDEDDWPGWQSLTARLGDQVELVGDDLFVTNPERLQRGIELDAANSVLIKMNQIGTLSETLAVVDLAKQAGFGTVVSARSGETEDASLADLAVATGAGQIKIGSVFCSERLAKYNQLLRIEEALGTSCRFAGRAVFKRLTQDEPPKSLEEEKRRL